MTKLKLTGKILVAATPPPPPHPPLSNPSASVTRSESVFFFHFILICALRPRSSFNSYMEINNLILNVKANDVLSHVATFKVQLLFIRLHFFFFPPVLFVFRDKFHSVALRCYQTVRSRYSNVAQFDADTNVFPFSSQNLLFHGGLLSD